MNSNLNEKAYFIVKGHGFNAEFKEKYGPLAVFC